MRSWLYEAGCQGFKTASLLEPLKKDMKPLVYTNHFSDWSLTNEIIMYYIYIYICIYIYIYIIYINIYIIYTL